MFNRSLSYLLIRYISPCMVFSDLVLISLDKEELLIDVKYVICTHFLGDSFMAETSSGKSAFLLAEFLPIYTNYIMTTRDTKGSHSTPDLPEKSTTRVDFFKSSTRPSKQPQKDLENTPTITINSPSTSYSNNQDEQYGFKSSGHHSKRAGYLAFKLGRLRDKAGRYNSHMLFLETCMTENVIPNGKTIT